MVFLGPKTALKEECLYISEFMGKMFQAAQLTHERFLTYLTYSTKYTPEVSGSSVWQISKKHIYGQKYLMG